MAKLAAALVLLIALGGGATLAYNVVRYGVADPRPLTWTRRPTEIRLLELRREREGLAARAGAEGRVASLAGMPLGASTESGGPGTLPEALAALDRQIAALEAAVAAGR